MISCRSPEKLAATIENVGKLHSRFKDLTEEIVDFFSLPILMALIAGFLQTLSNLYTIYLYNKKYETWKKREILVNFNLSSWFLIILIEMFILSSVSASICEEVRKDVKREFFSNKF